MVNERPETDLPDLDLSGLEEAKDRQLGSIDEEIESMLERVSKLDFPKDELTICAMGNTRKFCPFDTETWAVNMGYYQIFQIYGHFEKTFLTHTQVHDVHGRGAFNWGDFNKLAEAGIEVYNTHKVKGLNSTLYPFKRISKKFNTEYFSNTISYMIALAIDMGYKKINFYGCDMMTTSEYAWEKGGLEYWLGRCHGMGIETFVAEGSSLLKTITGKPYGVKYFKLKDIDPTGSIRRQVKKYTPKSTSTGYMFEDPIRPPDPEPTKWSQAVSLGRRTGEYIDG